MTLECIQSTMFLLCICFTPHENASMPPTPPSTVREYARLLETYHKPINSIGIPVRHLATNTFTPTSSPGHSSMANHHCLISYSQDDNILGIGILIYYLPPLYHNLSISLSLSLYFPLQTRGCLGCPCPLTFVTQDKPFLPPSSTPFSTSVSQVAWRLKASSEEQLPKQKLTSSRSSMRQILVRQMFIFFLLTFVFVCVFLFMVAP